MPKSFSGLGVTIGLAADRTAISSPVAGQQFYETDTNKLYVYTGSAWAAPSMVDLGVMAGAYTKEAQATVELRKDNAGGLGPSLVLRNVSDTASSSADIKFSTDGTSAWDGTSARIIATKRSGGSYAGSLDLAIWNPTYGEQVGMSIRNSLSPTHSGVIFNHAGIAIDRAWASYPAITVLRTSSTGYDNANTYYELRVHGINVTTDSYPDVSGGDFSANFRIDGGSYYSSDERKKTAIEQVEGALDAVRRLRGVSFNTVNQELAVDQERTVGGKRYGFIAQEAAEVIPHAVNYYEAEDEPLENGYCNAYSLDYGGVVAVLTEAIKEQQVIIDDLSARLEALEASAP